MFPEDFARVTPNKPAVVMLESGFTMTYAELDAAANRLSNLLRAHGLKVGDHVALCLENHPRYMEIIWGCHYAGLIYTACSSRLTSGELSHIVNDCGAKVFITSKYKADQAEEISADTPGVQVRLMLDGVSANFSSYEDAVAASPDTALIDRVDGADMLYSSGTTGKPKGVLFPLPMTPIGNPSGVTTLGQFLFGMNETTVYLSPAPLYHAAPLRFVMAVHRLGGTAVIMEHFDPERFLAAIEQHKITTSQVVPTMFIRLLKLDHTLRSRYDVSSLQAVIHAAAPCPANVKEQIINWFGPVVHEYYAGTEGNGFVYCNSEQWMAHRGTVGQAIQGIIHICDDEGNEVPVGESGTVYFEGGAQFEYHNDKEKTASSRDPKGRGWSTLGDVGYLDADGFLYLTDRKAYMIISGGVNIYPQEAENVLVDHPEVADVAVFGIPNDEFGEEVKAVVQPIRNLTADQEKVLEKELLAFCRSQLADIKCPRSIDFRAELPRHPTGKLYKRLLKDEYWKAAGRSI